MTWGFFVLLRKYARITPQWPWRSISYSVEHILYICARIGHSEWAHTKILHKGEATHFRSFHQRQPIRVLYTAEDCVTVHPCKSTKWRKYTVNVGACDEELHVCYKNDSPRILPTHCLLLKDSKRQRKHLWYNTSRVQAIVRHTLVLRPYLEVILFSFQIYHKAFKLTSNLADTLPAALWDA